MTRCEFKADRNPQELNFDSWEGYSFETKKEMLSGTGMKILEVLGKPSKDTVTPRELLNIEMVLAASAILKSKEESEEERKVEYVKTLRDRIGAARSATAQSSVRDGFRAMGLRALGTYEGTEYLFREIVLPMENI